MPLLMETAALMSREQVERGAIEEIVTKDGLFALMPFKHVNGKSYDYRREDTLAQGAFLSPYDVVPESASTFTPVSTKLKILAGDVDIDKFLKTTQSDLNDQVGLQLAAKAKGMGRQFRNILVNGDADTNPLEFSGVRKLTPAAQTLIAGANGNAVTLGMIDELKDAVKLGADVLMMREGTWRAIKEILRSFGGNTATMMMIEGFGMLPALDGTPVIINEFLQRNEAQGSNANTTSIYALRLNEVDGLHGIVGGEATGLTYEFIGTVQNKDAERHRLKWYVGLALKATHSVARLKGITNV